MSWTSFKNLFQVKVAMLIILFLLEIGPVIEMKIAFYSVTLVI